MATTGGQTLNDRLNAARYAISGQGLARAVCKATTEELLAPKKKHLDYLLQCTFEANVSIPQMANFLIERTSHNSWVVVFKALITVHHLMCYGNERFTQYLASSNCSFQLSNFLDKTGVKGYEMSTFIRRYAKYLNEKALSYRLVALDFAKMKRGKEEGSLRTMSKDKLLKTLPILQNQVDALLEFDSNPMDLNNRVIEAAFMLLFRDLIRLFACYNDGIINLLEKYFEMQRKQCREALDLYKKFLIRMDKVGEFLKCAESFGIDKGDIPDLTKAPSSLLEALEQHLNALEAKGKRHKDKSSKEHSEQTKEHSEYSKSLNPEDETLKKALEEEAAMMNQLKEKHVKDKPFNPFLDTSSDLTSFDTSASSSTTQVSKNSSNDIIDLFGPSGTSNQPSNNLLNNQSNNLLFNSNQNGALNTQKNTITSNINNSQPLLINQGGVINKPSDLLGVLANNSNAFHSNIVNQNLNISSFSPYQNQTMLPNTPAAFPYPNPLMNPINSNSMNNQISQPLASTNINNMQNYTMQNTLNINGNNLLMNPAFNTASTSMNPFASGFAQPSTGMSNQPGNNTGASAKSFEPNFASAFGSTSNTSNGAAKKPPPSRPPPPSALNKSAFDAFGDILQPQKTSLMQPQSNSSNSMLSMMNNSNNLNKNNFNNNSNKQNTILKGDLDSTLANLALNLDLKPKKMPTKY